MAETFKQMMKRLRASEAARRVLGDPVAPTGLTGLITGQDAPGQPLNLDAPAAEPIEGTTATTPAVTPPVVPAAPVDVTVPYKGNDPQAAYYNHVANGIRNKFKDDFDVTGMADQEIVQRHHARFADTMTPEEYEKKLKEVYGQDFRPTLGQRVEPAVKAVKETAVGLAPFITAEAPKIVGALVPAAKSTARLAAKGLGHLIAPAFATGHLAAGITDAVLIAQQQKNIAQVAAGPDVETRTQEYFAKLQPGLSAQGLSDPEIMDEARRRAQNVEVGRLETVDSIDQTIDGMQRQQVTEVARAVTDGLFLGFGDAKGPLNWVLTKAGIGIPATQAAELAASKAPFIMRAAKSIATGAVIGGVSLGAGGATRAGLEAGAASMTPEQIARETIKGGEEEGGLGLKGGAILGGAASVLEGGLRGTSALLRNQEATRAAKIKVQTDAIDAARLEGFETRKVTEAAEEARVSGIYQQNERRAGEVRASKMADLAHSFDPHQSSYDLSAADPTTMAQFIIEQEHGEAALGTEAGLRASSIIARKIAAKTAADLEMAAPSNRDLGPAGPPIEGRPELTQPGALAGQGQVPEAAPTYETRPLEPQQRMQGTANLPEDTAPQPLPETAKLPPLERGMTELLADVRAPEMTHLEKVGEALAPVKRGESSGHTFNVDTMEPDKKPGYVVSVRSKNIQNLTPEAVLKYREDMAPWIAKMREQGFHPSIGVFALDKKPGYYSMDLNVNVPTEEQAHSIGRETNQESFAHIGPDGEWIENIPVAPEGKVVKTVRGAAKPVTPEPVPNVGTPAIVPTSAPVPAPGGLKIAEEGAPPSGESVLTPSQPAASSSVASAISKLQVGNLASVTEREGGLHIERLGLPEGKPAPRGELGATLDHIIATADEHNLPVTSRLTKIDSNGGRIPIEKQLKGYWEPRGFSVTASTKLPEGQMATADVMRPAQGGKPAVSNMGMVSSTGAQQTASAIAAPDSPSTENLAAPAQTPAPGKLHQMDLFFDNNIAQARERIKARQAEFPEADRAKERERGSFSNKPREAGAKDHVSYDLADLADHLQIGVNLLLKHGLNKIQWAEQMVRELGSAIRPALDRIYAEAVSTLANRRPSGLDEVRIITDKYTREVGLGAGATRHDVFPKLDEKFATRVANEYHRLQNVTEGTTEWKAAKQSYDALNQEIAAQFRAIKEAGYTVEFSKDDPYPTSADMRGDISVNKHLRAFASDGAPHQFMTAEQNNMLRAVHDFFGHAAEGYEFGPRGEDAAFRKHASTLSEDALPALTTETRGQNSWVNFFADHQSLAPKDRPFAEQKSGLLPSWTYEDVSRARLNRAPTSKLGQGLKAGKASPEGFKNAIEALAQGVRPASRPETIKARFMADGANTIAERMITHPESATWYREDIAKMHALVADRLPEVHTPGGQALFDLLLGFTSPQKPVTDNFAIAYEMMHDYTRTGKVPMLRRFGQEVNTVSRKWVPKLNDLIAANGGDLEKMRDYLLSKNDKGQYNVTREFGPKVGPFTLNIQGIHDQVTVDVWMIRRLRRLAGQLRNQTMVDGKPLASEQTMLTDGIRELAASTGLDPDAVQAILWDHEKDVWDKAGHRAPKIPFSKAAEGVFANMEKTHKAVSSKMDESQQRFNFETSPEGQRRTAEADIMRNIGK